MGVIVRGQFPRGNHSGVITWGTKVWGELSWENFIGDNCPGGSGPDECYSGVIAWETKEINKNRQTPHPNFLSISLS